MKVTNEILESSVPFAESLIWQINRNYYQEAGLSAWSEDVVPHGMTSSAFVGKTYAALILGFLKDIAAERLSDDGITHTIEKNALTSVEEKVHIVELGSGHGRLAFHILYHLEDMIALEEISLPSYCLVLTDIVESNLDFFQNHFQFKRFIEEGKLEVAYFDAVASESIDLRVSGKTIQAQKLNYPIIAIANYFFDSIPNDLYRIEGDSVTSCDITLSTNINQETASESELLKSLTADIHKSLRDNPSQSPMIAEILKEYRSSLDDTFLLMPRLGMECINNLKKLSQKGLMLISMDKGYALLKNLKNRPQPEIIKHGSFSLYVNYHALSRFCEHSGGKPIFASFSDFSLKLACLIFLPNTDNYKETIKAYEHYVNDFGPDDYSGLKRLLLRNRQNLTIRELISGLRLSYYDSSLFVHLLPHIRQHTFRLTLEERKRLGETLIKTGENYFAINESIDVSYEIGGLLYDLGFYTEALNLFERASNVSGNLADLYYNRILCHYQLRQDKLFVATMAEAKVAFPGFEKFDELDKLDLGAS